MVRRAMPGPEGVSSCREKKGGEDGGLYPGQHASGEGSKVLMFLTIQCYLPQEGVWIFRTRWRQGQEEDEER